jgi:hypothetical protein
MDLAAESSWTDCRIPWSAGTILSLLREGVPCIVLHPKVKTESMSRSKGYRIIIVSSSVVFLAGSAGAFYGRHSAQFPLLPAILLPMI